MNCRYCDSLLEHTFVDLGHAPPSNAYLCEEALRAPEIAYPLRVLLCANCFFVQTEAYTTAHDLFRSDYAYFSSASSSWLKHAEDYTSKMVSQLGLGARSSVVEIACNDGYLLKNFVARGIPCLGVEPTLKTAAAAERLGVPVVRAFFDLNLARRLVREGHSADLICGNNVYAHVPDIKNFTAGLRMLLKPDGVVTLEFPHLPCMIENTQFDTIYHEHFSYFSLDVVIQIFDFADLRVFHVEELSTHGGSLRVYGCRRTARYEQTFAVTQVLTEEKRRGLKNLETYCGFQSRANHLKNSFLAFLIEAAQRQKRVAGYGAAAKANTLLNFAGVKPDLLPFICDAAASKQGQYMPGSHIPIVPPGVLERAPPDYLVIFPWNIEAEIKEELAFLQHAGTRFVTAVPQLTIS